MRRLTAITILFFFSFLIKSETAGSKSKCRACFNHPGVNRVSQVNAEDHGNDFRQYDGFLFKI